MREREMIEMIDRKFTALCLASVLISIALSAQTQHLSSPVISSVAIGAGSQSIGFRNNGILHMTEKTKAGEFLVISMDGCGNTNEVGSPQLPVLRTEVEVPLDASVSLTITNYTVVEYALSAWGSNLKILPFQQSV